MKKKDLENALNEIRLLTPVNNKNVIAFFL
jgi:hypothetical protein